MEGWGKIGGGVSTGGSATFDLRSSIRNRIKTEVVLLQIVV